MKKKEEFLKSLTLADLIALRTFYNPDICWYDEQYRNRHCPEEYKEQTKRYQANIKNQELVTQEIQNRLSTVNMDTK